MTLDAQRTAFLFVFPFLLMIIVLSAAHRHVVHAPVPSVIGVPEEMTAVSIGGAR